MARADKTQPTRPANNWYVVSGGPGSGKTTLIRLLEQRGYATVPEHARHFIDDELLKGRTIVEIRQDQSAFQRKVLELQLDQEGRTPADQVTFFDRGLPDTLAYHRFHALPRDELIERAVAACSYKRVFILDTLPLISDYARTESASMQRQIQHLIWDVYGSLPFPVIRIPVVPPLARLELILHNL